MKKSGSESGTYVKLITALKTGIREVPGVQTQQELSKSEGGGRTFLSQDVEECVWILEDMMVYDSIQKSLDVPGQQRTRKASQHPRLDCLPRFRLHAIPHRI